MDELQLDDIQGLLRHGYPYYSEGAYLLLSIDDTAAAAAAAKAWMAGFVNDRLVDDARSTQQWIVSRPRMVTPANVDVPPHRHCSIALAFSARGIRTLGVGADDMRTFTAEFQQGMSAPHRSRLLGDEGPDRPGLWEWGGPNRPVDILMIVFTEPRYYDACLAFYRNLPAGVSEVSFQHGRLRPREPFGFMDGISQPIVEGLTRQPARPGERRVRPGEFVLGYQNEFGRYPASPSLALPDAQAVNLPRQSDGRADLGRNGTFLVLRQLEQHVSEFDKFLTETGDAMTRMPGAPATGAEDLAQWVAAKMVGRWKSGAPLVRFPHDDVEEPEAPTSAQDRRRMADLVAGNDFGFHREDRHGFLCPIGAHIRRANPRDSLADASGVSPEVARAMVDQHRLLRRGRQYRRNGSQGLLFLALNANLERQFEFVQNSWVMHPEFGGLSGESDPLLGASPRRFSLQRPTVSRCIDGLRRFITVKGGEYFFLPGLRALEYLLRP